MTQPAIVPPVDALSLSQIVDRAAASDFDQWWTRVTGSGYCTRPIHLTGRDQAGAKTTAMGRCKNRRAAVCPSCSDLYAADTWQLIHGGLDPYTDHARGDGSASHPMVFVTLTAPSFGTVHSRHTDNRGGGQPCRPGDRHRRCRHGTPLSCMTNHHDTDPKLGQPLCGDCYDYPGHVLFTWHAPQLWHRFTICLRRLVARELRHHGEDPARVKVAYAKVMEMQRRAIPHYHAVIRLDAADSPNDQQPPQATTTLTADGLARLVMRAVTAVRLDVPGPGGELITLTLGHQTNAQAIAEVPDSNADDTATMATPRRVAAYLAKYVTKSVAELGLSATRLSVASIPRLQVSDHIRALLQTIADLATLPGRSAMLGWLHTLGYRGHITTKTRRYSTTMTALRARRQVWRRSRIPGNGMPRSVSEPARATAEPTVWTFTGYGHRNDGDRLLVLSAALRTRAERAVARTETAALDALQHAQGWP